MSRFVTIPALPRRLLHAVSSALLSSHVLLCDRRVYARAEELGLVATPLEVPRTRGGALRGAVFERAETESANAPTVVFFCGNCANISGHLLYVELLARAGCRVVAVDASGSGASDGRPQLGGLLDDAHAICDRAVELAAAGTADSRIGVFGVSLGANVALAVAAARDDVRAIACEGLSDQRDIVEGLVRQGTTGVRRLEEIRLDGQPLPARDRLELGPLRLPGPIARAISRLASITYPFDGKDPLRFVDAIGDRPLLLVHGTHDPLLPIEITIEVFAALAGRPKVSFWPIPGVGHAQDPALTDDAEYVSRLADCFSCLRGETVGDSPGGPVLEVGDRTLEITASDDLVAGGHLVVAAAERGLHLRRVWVEPGSRRVVADLPSEPRVVSLRRAPSCERAGDGWLHTVSTRAEMWRSRFATPIAAIGMAVRRGRVEEAGELLAAAASGETPSPLDLVLRLHASRLEAVAGARHPRTARQAREIFTRLGGEMGMESST